MVAPYLRAWAAEERAKKVSGYYGEKQKRSDKFWMFITCVFILGFILGQLIKGCHAPEPAAPIATYRDAVAHWSITHRPEYWLPLFVWIMDDCKNQKAILKQLGAAK